MKSKKSLSKMLSEYHPIPSQRFYQKMETAPWHPKRKNMSNRSTRPFRFVWQMAIAVILVIVVLGLSIPAVRASLSAWLGLSVAPSNQMPAAPVTLVAVVSPTPASIASPVASLPTPPPATAIPTPVSASNPTPQTASTEKPSEISQYSAQAGWNILAPGSLPAGYQYQSAYFDTNHQMLILTYTSTKTLPNSTDPSLTTTQSITFLQAKKNDFVPLQVSPDASLVDVQVSGKPAVYTIGAWDTSFVPDDKSSNGGQMVSTWRNDLPVKNLYWQVGDIYLALITADPAISQQDLMDMAASVSGP